MSASYDTLPLIFQVYHTVRTKQFYRECIISYSRTVLVPSSHRPTSPTVQLPVSTGLLLCCLYGIISTGLLLCCLYGIFVFSSSFTGISPRVVLFVFYEASCFFHVNQTCPEVSRFFLLQSSLDRLCLTVCFVA